MKKSLLLAALLLSSTAQAETWVCTTPSSFGGSNLVTFVRQEKEFTNKLTLPAEEGFESMEMELIPAKILSETGTMLTLARIDPDGTEVHLAMINKITKKFVSDGVYFSSDVARTEGSCVSI